MNPFQGHQRVSGRRPCPICGGHAGLARGQGIRCAGFPLDLVAYCTREERAGRLPIDISTSPPAYKHLLRGNCGCGAQHQPGLIRAILPVRTVLEDNDPILPLDDRDRIYRFALARLPLRPDAEHDLTRRGLTTESIERVGYRSVPVFGTDRTRFLAAMRDEFGESALCRCPGFSDKNGRLFFWSARKDDGYIVPYRDEVGRITGLQMKVLDGRYLTARGTRVRDVYHMAGPGAPGMDLFLTEGGLKAEVSAGLGPVWCMGTPGQILTPEHIAVIQRLQPGRVVVALDEETNPNTTAIREKWLQSLWETGIPVYRATWEQQN